MLLIPLLRREAGKNITEKGRRGRTGDMFLVSMLLIPLLMRKAGKNIREKARRGRTGGYVPGQYVADTTPQERSREEYKSER